MHLRQLKADEVTVFDTRIVLIDCVNSTYGFESMKECATAFLSSNAHRCFPRAFIPPKYLSEDQLILFKLIDELALHSRGITLTSKPAINDFLDNQDT